MDSDVISNEPQAEHYFCHSKETGKTFEKLAHFNKFDRKLAHDGKKFF